MSSNVSTEKCQEFAVHLREKIDTIRSNLHHYQLRNFNAVEHLFVYGETLKMFVLVDAEMLSKVISPLKGATSHPFLKLFIAFWMKIYAILETIPVR